MSKRRTNAAHDLLESLFVADDREHSNDEVLEIVKSISSDDALRETFDRLALADRGLHGADGPARFERDFGRLSFDAQLDQMLSEEEAEESETDKVVPLRPTREAPARPVAAWLSAAAVLLVGSLAVIGIDDGSVVPEFQARTAAATDFERPDTSSRLLAFCAERIDGDVRFTGPDEAPFGVVTCPADAELKLAIEQRGSARRHAAFFGVHENGTVTWYGPSPADHRPITVDSDEPVIPVGETIRLGVNHEPGAVRIHALFTDEPVDFPALERWVARQGPTLFDHAMVVETAVGETDTQLFEVAEER